MLYDYLITQFYPKIGGFVLISLITIMVVIALYVMFKPSEGYSYSKPEELKIYKKRWLSKVITVVIVQASWLGFLAFIPDVEYVKYFYGDVREITPNQKETLNKALEAQYVKSEKLFQECLINGQKQPNVTTFNDTNEVVKTCYKVAKYRF